MPGPSGSKVPKNGVSRISILGTVIMIFGFYSVVWYLDAFGEGAESEASVHSNHPSTWFLERSLIQQSVAAAQLSGL